MNLVSGFGLRGDFHTSLIEMNEASEDYPSSTLTLELSDANNNALKPSTAVTRRRREEGSPGSAGGHPEISFTSECIRCLCRRTRDEANTVQLRLLVTENTEEELNTHLVLVRNQAERVWSGSPIKEENSKTEPDRRWRLKTNLYGWIQPVFAFAFPVFKLHLFDGCSLASI